MSYFLLWTAGILPFLLEYTVYLADPISENVVCGLLYFVAMIVAAGGTQAATSMTPRACVVCLVMLVGLEA